MAELHVQRKRRSPWLLWLIIILIIAAVLYYLYVNYYQDETLTSFLDVAPLFYKSLITSIT